MMKIEYLYPELGNLFGDSANMKYLRLTLPEAEIVETHLGDRPAFADGADLTYCGPMTENGQALAAAALSPWAEALREAVDVGRHFLFTGNSFELLGDEIEYPGGPLVCAGVLPLSAKRSMDKRKNGFYLGRADGVDITGFISRFSDAWPRGLDGFAQTLRGLSINPDSRQEGIRVNNLVGTYLLGPLLPLNPDWTKKLLVSMGSDAEPAYYAAAKLAYEKRLEEFRDLKREID